MSEQNVELARRGYEALMRGALDAVAELFAPDLTRQWWQKGPWDCHGREEAMTVIGERRGQRAIGELQEIIDVDQDRIAVVKAATRRTGELRRDGRPRGSRRERQLGHHSRRQGGLDAGLQDQADALAAVGEGI